MERLPLRSDHRLTLQATTSSRGSEFASAVEQPPTAVAHPLPKNDAMAPETATPPIEPGNETRTSAAGLVVIGRNEGARLVRCLEACAREGGPVVYVDSGSTDGSSDTARRLGAAVVALDMTTPFTAARARNEGFAELLRLHPALARVQFLDGDCELVGGWLTEASAFLDDHPEIAAVCGRRLERFPDASLFNQLCDIEWNRPAGITRAFGGDVLIRSQAFAAAGGYRADLIAGEEPELCVRLRGAGWKIWRLARDMTWHDAAMTRWSQWWRRNVRAGHAFAEGAFLHGGPPERHYVAEARRAVLWGVALPIALLLAPVAWLPLAWLWLAYPLQWLRIGLRLRRAGQEIPWTQSAFFLLGRFAEASGVLRFWSGHAMHRRSAIIEYK